MKVALHPLAHVRNRTVADSSLLISLVSLPSEILYATLIVGVIKFKLSSLISMRAKEKARFLLRRVPENILNILYSF